MKAILEHITPDIKALIFDLDGTLANTIPLHLDAWTNTGEELGLHITHEMILEHSGTPTKMVSKILANKYQWDVGHETITEKKLHHYSVLKKQYGKVEAIVPILEIAKSYYGKLPLAIGTGSTRKGAMKSLEDIDAVGLFDIIVTASDVTNPKPDPETFLKSAFHFNVAPEECIVFEDGAAGIKAAQSANMKLIDVRDYL